MEPQPAYEKLDTLQIVDVRQDVEFASGHIESSIHIPLKELPARIGELDAERRTLVVCQIGQRSDMGARFLRSQGIDAHNLDGGVKRWVRSGYPLTNESGNSGEVIDGWPEILED
jgi:rhodanese-related sulfurtransferase